MLHGRKGMGGGSIGGMVANPDHCTPSIATRMTHDYSQPVGALEVAGGKVHGQLLPAIPTSSSLPS